MVMLYVLVPSQGKVVSNGRVSSGQLWRRSLQTPEGFQRNFTTFRLGLIFLRYLPRKRTAVSSGHPCLSTQVVAVP